MPLKNMLSYTKKQHIKRHMYQLKNAVTGIAVKKRL
jgi:hypothetical protein